MMKKNSAKFLIFAAISLLLHLLLFGGLVLFEESAFLAELRRRLDHKVVDATKDVVTQIELVDLKENMKQIVQQSEKSIDETLAEDAKFLSIKNQNIEKETKSSRNGKFNNASNTPKGGGRPSAPQQASPGQAAQQGSTGKKSAQQQQASKPRAPKIKNLGLTGLAPSFDPAKALNRELKAQQQVAQERRAQAARQARQASPSVAPGGEGLSQTDDYLKDIEFGAQTLLKTKQYKYYSFFSRVREQLRTHWNPRIRQKVNFLYHTGRYVAAQNPKATSLRVTLNKKGYLEKIELLKTSGLTALDEAAIEAFREAAPFPNPPKGMLETDKKIRIFWDFILET